jgi:hypothetical protein
MLYNDRNTRNEGVADVRRKWRLLDASGFNSHYFSIKKYCEKEGFRLEELSINGKICTLSALDTQGAPIRRLSTLYKKEE